VGLVVRSRAEWHHGGVRQTPGGPKRLSLGGAPLPAAALAGATPERRLLVACLAPSPVDPADLAPLTTEPLDWAVFLALARRNRVMPTVDTTLRPLAKAGALPDWFVGELRKDKARNLANGQLLALGVVRVSQLLADAGVRALVFKGPVLALGLYGSVGARQFNDLDLLVDPTDARPVRDTLVAAGFELREDFEWTQSYSEPDSRLHLDLHQRLFPPEFRCDLTFERAWAQHVELEIEGGRVPTFGTAHRFIGASLQVAKDGWEQRLLMQKVLDVAAASRSATAAEFSTIADEAGRTRFTGIVSNAIESARSIGLGPTVDNIDQRLLPTQRGRSYADAAMARLWNEDIDYPKPVVMAQRHRLLREHAIDGVRPFAARVFAAPTEIDEARFKLPAPLRPLYRVLRPLRMVTGHAVRTVRHKWANRRS